jgi:hypothetical protein
MLGAIVAVIVAMQQGGWTRDAVRGFVLQAPDLRNPAIATWLGLVSAGYLLCLASIHRHVARLQQFALAFNASVDPNVGHIPIPKLPWWRVKPAYLIVAVAMMLLWSIWALPMMLAWGAWHGFVYRADAAFRNDLADRLTQLSGVAPVVDRASQCRNPACGASLSDDARFCPRCGSKVGLFG